MRVALGQIDMAWEDKSASIKKAKKMIEDASGLGADIIVFPEMSFTGCTLNLEIAGESMASGETVGIMKELAVKYGVAIGFGWASLPKGEGNKGLNIFTVVDSAGETVAEYAKMHPFTYGGESGVYEKGSEIVSAPFLGRVISLFICYDLRFPEIFQIASRKADVIFVIANWPAIRSAHWTTLLRARAIETQSYIVGVNCYGFHDGQYYSGDSMAVDSIGNVLGQISGREGVLMCDLDDRARSLRNKFNTRKDRREKLYGSFFTENNE